MANLQQKALQSALTLLSPEDLISVQTQLNQTLWYVNLYNTESETANTLLINATDINAVVNALYHHELFVGHILQSIGDGAVQMEEALIVQRAIDAGYLRREDYDWRDRHVVAEQYRSQLLYSDYPLATEMLRTTSDNSDSHLDVIGRIVIERYATRPNYIRTVREMTMIVLASVSHFSILNIGTGKRANLSEIWPEILVHNFTSDAEKVMAL